MTPLAWGYPMQAAPTLNGFDDSNRGTGYIPSAFVDALCDMYGKILTNTLPSVLVASIKDVAANYISDACPNPDAHLNSLVDYTTFCRS